MRRVHPRLPAYLSRSSSACLQFGFALLASVCLGGPLSTGIREYALMFYGGRYQALGDILSPPPAPRPGEPQIA